MKNEYLALATLGVAGALVAAVSAGGKKASDIPAHPTVDQVKESVQFNASSKCVRYALSSRSAH